MLDLLWIRNCFPNPFARFGDPNAALDSKFFLGLSAVAKESGHIPLRKRQRLAINKGLQVLQRFLPAGTRWPPTFLARSFWQRLKSVQRNGKLGAGFFFYKRIGRRDQLIGEALDRNLPQRVNHFNASHWNLHLAHTDEELPTGVALHLRL